MSGYKEGTESPFSRKNNSKEMLKDGGDERQEEGCGHARDSEGTTCKLALFNPLVIHWLSWGFNLSPRTWGGFLARRLCLQQCEACFWLWIIGTHWSPASPPLPPHSS